MIGLWLTTAVMGAATGLGYNSMAPRSQLFGRTFIGNGTGSRQIALTFDDGPSETNTLPLLEVLERHGVKATFFMIGRYVSLSPRIAQAVAGAGHVIGNHTFTHPNLIFCSRTQIRLQLEECERALSNAVGKHSRLFRPPHGARRPDVLQVVRKMGFEPVMWSVSGYDWNPHSPAQIEVNVARQVRGGDVVLLHDGGHTSMNADRSSTVAATNQLIRRYRDQGYTFVTVPEMMEASGRS
jgi:peptidoglycan/xylan/chitin deacetylase (PgdA/CDA1 family)